MHWLACRTTMLHKAFTHTKQQCSDTSVSKCVCVCVCGCMCMYRRYGHGCSGSEWPCLYAVAITTAGLVICALPTKWNGCILLWKWMSCLCLFHRAGWCISAFTSNPVESGYCDWFFSCEEHSVWPRKKFSSWLQNCLKVTSNDNLHRNVVKSKV